MTELNRKTHAEDDRPSMTVQTRTIAVIAIVSALVVSTTVIRYQEFHGLEPRIDQATFAQWVRSLRACDHLLPVSRPGEGFRSAVQGDDRALVTAVARPVFVALPLMFTLATLALAVAYTAFTGATYSAFIGFSVGASAATIGAIAMLGAVIARQGRYVPTSGQRLLGPVLPATLLALNYYAYAYSPWGIHNVGVLSLVLATGATVRWQSALSNESLANPNRYRTAVIFQWLAFYSHWTNVLLLVPATVLAFVVLPSVHSRVRTAALTRYLAAISIAALPALMIAVGSHAMSVQSPLVYAGDLQRGAFGYAYSSVSRAGEWFNVTGSVASPWAVASAVVGLGLMWVRRGAVLPATMLLTHGLLWALMPGFSWNGSNTGLRTINYAIPFLMLGAAWTVVEAMGWMVSIARRRSAVTRVGTLIAGILVVGQYGVRQWVLLSRGSGDGRWGASFQEHYLEGQGRLAPLVRDIAVRARNGDVWAWSDTFRTVLDLNAESGSFVSMPALFSAERHLNSGDLSAWLTMRRVRSPSREVYVVIDGEVSEARVSDVVGAVVRSIHAGVVSDISPQAIYEPPWPGAGRVRLVKALVTSL